MYIYIYCIFAWMIFFEASYVQACNLKHPLISSYSSCFNWMIAILYIGNGSFTKHPFETGCFGYQKCFFLMSPPIQRLCRKFLVSEVCRRGRTSRQRLSDVGDQGVGLNGNKFQLRFGGHLTLTSVVFCSRGRFVIS